MTRAEAEAAYIAAQNAFDKAAGAWVAAALNPKGDAKERARMFVALVDLNRAGIDFAWAKASELAGLA